MILWNHKCPEEREKWTHSFVNIFGSFYWTPLLDYFWIRITGTSFYFHFFREDYSISFLDWIFSEENFEEFWPFLEWIGTQWRFWAGVCIGIVWWKWMTIPGVGDCHTRHFEASKKMSTQRRKTGRWQVPFIKRTHHSTKLKVNQDSLW